LAIAQYQTTWLARISDTIHTILDYLTPLQLAQAGESCRAMRMLCHDNDLRWMREVLALDPTQRPAHPSGWRRIYATMLIDKKREIERQVGETFRRIGGDAYENTDFDSASGSEAVSGAATPMQGGVTEDDEDADEVPAPPEPAPLDEDDIDGAVDDLDDGANSVLLRYEARDGLSSGRRNLIQSLTAPQ